MTAHPRPPPPDPGLIPGTDIPAAPAFLDTLAAEAAAPGLRKGERTRRRVRLATATCLLDTTVAALSMEQIAAEAGVSRTSLYQYVPSKEETVRDVLADFQERLLATLRPSAPGLDLAERIYRTNRYYVDHVSKNAVFMERVREARDTMPELLAVRQAINGTWASRVAAHVARTAARPDLADDPALRLRVLALECMVDDVLREVFVIRNPAFAAARRNLDLLARELSAIWMRALYGDDAAGVDRHNLRDPARNRPTD